MLAGGGPGGGTGGLFPGLTHHGWSWTTGENVRLTGAIAEVRLGNPHSELTLDVDGAV